MNKKKWIAIAGAAAVVCAVAVLTIVLCNRNNTVINSDKGTNSQPVAKINVPDITPSPSAKKTQSAVPNTPTPAPDVTPVPPTAPPTVLPVTKAPAPTADLTIVPKGCTYKTASGTVLTEGQKMPALSDGDEFTDSDYRYKYNYYSSSPGGIDWVPFKSGETNGWGVRVLDSEKTSYAKIRESINGANITSLQSTFRKCYYLETAPELPSTVTDMNSTFNYCSSLIAAPAIPPTVTTMIATFSLCRSLQYASAIPYGVKDLSFAFEYCESMITAPDIPGSVTKLNSTFVCCKTLTQAPAISYGVTEMTATFFICTKLKNAPVIPDSVVSMIGTFDYCLSLTAAPEIPNGVTNMDQAFEFCTSLTAAPVIPASVESMVSIFADCTALSGTVIIHANLKPRPVFKDPNMPVSGSVTVVTSAPHYPYSGSFSGTVNPIQITGSSPQLSELAASASNGNVTVQ